MTERLAKVGTRVKSNIDFYGVPKGTTGTIDEDYGGGVMVSWDMPDGSRLRDGFNKDRELQFLDVI